MSKLKTAVILALSGVVLTACSQGDTTIAAGSPMTEQDKYSYGFGYNIASNFNANSIDINPAFFNAGVYDAMNGQDAKMTPEQIRDAINALQNRLMAEQKQEQEALADKNLAAGKAFLEENGAKDGIETTDSGLQYQIVSVGDGAIPAATDTVEVHYEGRLLDGTVFDSSYKRGEPAKFPVRGVIAGWTEALQLMPVGSKWKLFIPSDLAYGASGAGAQIAPNATLVFDVELLSIDGQGADGDAGSDAGSAASGTE